MGHGERRSNRKAARSALGLMGLGYVIGESVELLFKFIRMAITGKDITE